MLFGNIILRRWNIFREINTLSYKLVDRLDDHPEIVIKGQGPYYIDVEAIMCIRILL